LAHRKTDWFRFDSVRSSKQKKQNYKNHPTQQQPTTTKNNNINASIKQSSKQA